MRSYSVPGATLAIVRHGRLLLNRSYGLADVQADEPARTESLFRAGSIGKTITATAVLRLVEKGRLDLDARVFDLLSDIPPRNGRIRDARTRTITVRHLLQHSGGWDPAKTGDPVSIPLLTRIASDMRVSSPPSCRTLISWMLDRNLDFAPGSRFAYSNFGYCVLGRVIEKVSGKSYEEFVRSEVLAPLGITHMRLGRTLASQRAEGEVRYYDYPGAPLYDSVFSSVAGKLSGPYGGTIALETVDSAGAWISTAADLARIFSMLSGSCAPAVISQEMVAKMIAPGIVSSATQWYGFGMVVEADSSDVVWWHNGGMPGVRSWAGRLKNGYVAAAMFNTRPKDESRFDEQLVDILSSRSLDAVTWGDRARRDRERRQRPARANRSRRADQQLRHLPGQ
jgi:N-acyl-D-amino-acid deacylase